MGAHPTAHLTLGRSIVHTSFRESLIALEKVVNQAERNVTQAASCFAI
jgi:hypothetical protein